jgi:hypothetical protein
MAVSVAVTRVLQAEAGLDLAVLSRDFSDAAILKSFVRIHDRIAAGEMPPADEERPDSREVAAVTGWLDRAPVLEALLTCGIANMLGDDLANVGEDTVTIDLVLLYKVSCELLHMLYQSASMQ